MLVCFDIATTYLIFVLVPSYVVNVENENKREINILGIFGTEDKEEEQVFRNAIKEANYDLKRTDFTLLSDLIPVKLYDGFNLSKNLCSKLNHKNFGAILGSTDFELSDIVKSIAKIKSIPYINTRSDDTSRTNTSKIYINLFPDSLQLANAISSILEDMDWETFTLIYESPESLITLQEVLKKKMGRLKYERSVLTLKQLPKNRDDYKSFLKEIKNLSETHIMLHCSTEKIMGFFEIAKEIDLLGPYKNFFVTSLDSHTIDLSKFANNNRYKIYTQGNITTLRLVNTENTLLNIHKWNENEINSNVHNLNEKKIKTNAVLIRDSVLLLAQALKDMPRNFTTKTFDCFTNLEFDKWKFGENLVEKMKSINFKGFTGEMLFDDNTGKRNYFLVEIIEITAEGIRTLGTWDPKRGIKQHRNTSQIIEESSLSIANRTLRIVSKIVIPYLIKKEPDSSGNDQFEGFCKDLLDALARNLKFSYILTVPPDASPGELKKETGRYTGLIGELKELRADLAICDFTITPERKKAVDFTTPFMSLGISILYTAAPEKETRYFSFLDPFDVTVWIYLLTAYLGLPIVLYIMARFAPSEWEGSHPCDQEPEELENAWNLKNCLWLALGSILQQGCDILPKAISTRLTAGIWWFFTLIITSTYTANLAAFLTTQRMESPIKNIEDLANQDAVKYGCMRKGATADFFRNSNDSLYQRMWATMESSNPSVFVESNEKGVERVLRSRQKYAFFMESSSIEYQTKLHCELAQIGNPLDSKFYGIAVPKGSIFKDALTLGILELKENAMIDSLKSKWWKNPNNKTCSTEDDEDKNKLGLANVGGVFLVLIVGCVLAFFVAILEFLWNVRKVAIREKIHLAEAFWLELKFAFKCSKTTKPARHTPQSDILGTPISISQTNIVNKDV